MSKILHHSVLLECDTKTVFKYFTDNELLASWLVLPYQGSHAEIEPKIDGKYEIFWDPKSKENNSTLGCKITAIKRNKLLSFDWKGPVQFKHFMNSSDPLTHVTVFFIPIHKDNREVTEVHLIHSGWKSSPEWEEAREYFDKAWNSAFEYLRKQIKMARKSRQSSKA
jgi:uncharacterized protein YndB with AHSA1/START domain